MRSLSRSLSGAHTRALSLFGCICVCVCVCVLGVLQIPSLALSFSLSLCVCARVRVCPPSLITINVFPFNTRRCRLITRQRFDGSIVRNANLSWPQVYNLACLNVPEKGLVPSLPPPLPPFLPSPSPSPSLPPSLPPSLALSLFPGRCFCLPLPCGPISIRTRCKVHTGRRDLSLTPYPKPYTVHSELMQAP